ncbi:MAG: YigZ family protein [Acholeplasmataceae bacterium]
MLEIKDQFEHKIVINKSDFIGLLYPITSKEDIETYLLDAKTKYPKATHYCYAATLGQNRAWATYQDDGEPKGTAGLPILDVIDHHNLTNALLVVIRYFGGIKLGAGGLVRAYSNAASEVLKIANFYEKKEVYTYTITFPYHLIHQVESLVLEKGTILQKTFLDMVSFECLIEDQDLSFLDEIKHLLKFEQGENQFIYIPIER